MDRHGARFRNVSAVPKDRSRPRPPIRLRGAREHNLKGIDLDLEPGTWTSVVGPSGSGKTSLVFDVLVREGERRFLGSQSAKARQFFGKLGRPDVASLDGLPAPIAVGRRSITSNPRSTVGTQSGVLDLLRLLFARGASHTSGAALSRAHFSFNAPAGACPDCNGLGLEDCVDPDLIVADPSRSIRDGALVPTLPNGYTVYSQVTVDVMDTICRAHGFTVDTPWNELSDEQVHVIMHGTRALKVPFGKHSLESRMKWEGITAKPREEGFYRGLVPVIEETLLRNRNPNILRFVRSVPCPACGGTRLGPLGREAALPGGRRLPELLAMGAPELGRALDAEAASALLAEVRVSLDPILQRMERLGLGHLAMDRASNTLSGGEAQRLRLAAHLSAGLGGALYALDEPTLGLHPEAKAGMRDVLDELVEQGGTLAVVEHDPALVEAADRVIELGPGAGPEGGTIVRDANDARGALAMPDRIRPPRANTGRPPIVLEGATLHNLRDAGLTIGRGRLHVVIGPSGAGKSSLVFGTLMPALAGERGGPFASLESGDGAGVLAVDARPMGRSSRSTPATWSGIFDVIRRRFAATAEAKARKLGASAFSFNAKGGRCPECEGLGVKRIGLHLLEDAVHTCPACGGSRYRPETLEVKLDGRSIADVLTLSVREAAEAFADDEQIAPTLTAMADLGLGYLTLGTPSTTLSSGESQRIRLATLLARPSKAKDTLLLFDEPDRGLHPGDLARLLDAYDRLIEAGHTIVAVSHHPMLWQAADELTEVREGRTRRIELDEAMTTATLPPRTAERAASPTAIRVRGARTHNLKGVDVSIPHGRVTAVIGPSGSGKSSLAFDTIAAEAWRRYGETLPFQVRRFARRMPRPPVDTLTGLLPVLGLRQDPPAPGNRSTLATLSGVGPLLRLAWARAAGDGTWTAAHFRPESGLGPCASCGGSGVLVACTEETLVTDPSLPVAGGALAGTRPGRHFSEPDGQHVAMMRAAVDEDLDRPWQELSSESRRVLLEGAGDEVFDVTWEFKRGARSGTHAFSGTWDGLLRLVEREAHKRAGQKAAAEWRAPLAEAECPACGGTGLVRALAEAGVGGLSYRGALASTVEELLGRLPGLAAEAQALAALAPELRERLEGLRAVGLGAMALHRRAGHMDARALQRARLASVMGGGMSGTALVLDEPAAGLPKEFAEELARRLGEAAAEGNAIVVVTHRPELVRAADHVIVMGPGAGPEGGEVLAAGPPDEVDVNGWFEDAAAPEIPEVEPGYVSVRNGAGGLPRSGVVEVAASAASAEAIAAAAEGHYGAVVVPGRSAPGTSPLHALSLMPALQQLYAKAPGAEHLPKAAFSYLSPRGRCTACKGSGQESVAMDFMADLVLPCPACGGTRYRPEVLEVIADGLNVAEFLERPAQEHDLDQGPLAAGARVLRDVGLGHLSFGRRTSTLSGGERHRLALAAHLMKPKRHTLFVLDRPYRGLAPVDVAALRRTFAALARDGHAVAIVLD